MSQEIVDAVREIEREKGIESGTLVAALEDALLAAGEAAVRVAGGAEPVEIPYTDIVRANLIEEG